MTLTLSSLAAPVLGCLTAIAGAQSVASVGNGGPGPVKAQHLTVEMIAAGPQIAQGGTQTVGFVFSMEQDWHIFWLNPGGQGRPPEVTWSLPAGVTAGALQFPAPEWLPANKAVDYGYEDSVALPVTITADPTAKADKSGTLHLTASLSWVVCKVACVPGNADLGLDLQLVPAGSTVSSEGNTVGALGAAFKSMPKPLHTNIQLNAVTNGKDIAILAHTGVRETDADFYPIERNTIAPLDLAAEMTNDGAIVHLQRAPGLKKPPGNLHGLLKFATEESYVIDLPIIPGIVPPMKSASAASTSKNQHIIIWIAAVVALLAAVLLTLKRRSRKR